MAGKVKYGAMVVRIVGPEAAWRTQSEVITFMLPVSAEHTDLVFSTAQSRASKRWRRCWVTETWRE